MSKVRRSAHLRLCCYAVERAKIACRTQISRSVEIAGYGDRRNDHGHGYNYQQFKCGKSSLPFVVRYFLHTIRRRDEKPWHLVTTWARLAPTPLPMSLFVIYRIKSLIHRHA